MRAFAYGWASLRVVVRPIATCLVVALSLGLMLACTEQDLDEPPACASIDPTGLESESSPSGTSCPTPEVLKGTVPPGGSCNESSDCAPVCCACTAGDKSALAALCESGTCGSADDTCCVFRTAAAAQCGS